MIAYGIAGFLVLAGMTTYGINQLGKAMEEIDRGYECDEDNW